MPVSFVASTSQAGAATTSVSAGLPGSPQLTDLLVAALNWSWDDIDNQMIAVAPPGWSVLITNQSIDNSGTAGCMQAIYAKPIGASEMGPYEWDFTAPTDVTLIIHQYRGVDSGLGPVSGTTGKSGSNTTITSPALSVPPGRQGLEFNVFGQAVSDGIPINSTSGETKREDLQSAGLSSIMGADGPFSYPTAGQQTATTSHSGAVRAWVGQSLLLLSSDSVVPPNFPFEAIRWKRRRIQNRRDFRRRPWWIKQKPQIVIVPPPPLFKQPLLKKYRRRPTPPRPFIRHKFAYFKMPVSIVIQPPPQLVLTLKRIKRRTTTQRRQLAERKFWWPNSAVMPSTLKAMFATALVEEQSLGTAKVTEQLAATALMAENLSVQTIAVWQAQATIGKTGRPLS
jgi:hypothetical protein